jgi:hypothetical protein
LRHVELRPGFLHRMARVARQAFDRDDAVARLHAADGRMQERCTSPLMCTEQAPHCATPQPYLVPVSPTARGSPTGAACRPRPALRAPCR